MTPTWFLSEIIEIIKLVILELFSGKYLDEFDLFFSFRGSLRAKLFKLFVSSKVKNQYSKDKYKRGHQVEKYNNFVNESLNIDSIAKKLVINNVNNVNNVNKSIDNKKTKSSKDKINYSLISVDCNCNVKIYLFLILVQK